jgi:predicted nucleic acid-binding protein
VLDAHALLAYLEGEEGKETVISVLDEIADGQAAAFLCVVNWGEVWYTAFREGGEDRAKLYENTLAELDIQVLDVDRNLTLAAARLKGSHKMSYADAYAAATAKLKNALLVTGDKEFKSVEKEIKVKWIR